MNVKNQAAILAALLLWSCASNTSPARSAEELEVERVNAVADASLLSASAPLLAIEVEITVTDVRPIGASIIFAHPPADSAFPELRVRADGVEGWEYTIANPLVAQVEDPDDARMVLFESARIHVFAPLSPSLRSITIEPIVPTERPVSGGTFDVRELALRACAGRESVRACLPFGGGGPDGSGAGL